MKKELIEMGNTIERLSKENSYIKLLRQINELERLGMNEKDILNSLKDFLEEEIKKVLLSTSSTKDE